MNLWNNMVPDLVKLSESEMDAAIDKLPHSRFPAATSPESMNPVSDGAQKEDEKMVVYVKDKKNTYGGLDGSEGIPVSVVIIVGMILLMLNLCACAGVIYQKKRVRQRENSLQQRIRGMSDAGLMSAPSSSNGDEHGPYCISNPESMAKQRHHSASGMNTLPAERTACSGSEGESMDEEDETDDGGVYMVRNNHFTVYHDYNSLGSQRLAAKSNEALFQSLPDRSDLHRHSKSIPNFNQQLLPYEDGRVPPERFVLTSPVRQPSPYIVTSSNVAPMRNIPIGHETARSRSAATLNMMTQHIPESGAASGHVSDTGEGSSNRRPRLLGLPKVLPDLPSVCTNISKRKGPFDGSDTDSDRIPSPIIEVVTDFEPMYHNQSASTLSSPTSSLQRSMTGSHFGHAPGNYAVPRNLNRPPPHLLNDSHQQHYAYPRQPLYSGAVYPIYNVSSAAGPRVPTVQLPPRMPQRTSADFGPSRMVAFRGSEPLSFQNNLQSHYPPSSSHSGPLRPRVPPVLSKSVEQSTHVPIYQSRGDPVFVSNPNNNPSVTLPPGSKAKDCGDSHYGFLPSSLKKNSGKSAQHKKKIEFDLNPLDGSTEAAVVAKANPPSLSNGEKQQPADSMKASDDDGVSTMDGDDDAAVSGQTSNQLKEERFLGSVPNSANTNSPADVVTSNETKREEDDGSDNNNSATGDQASDEKAPAEAAKNGRKLFSMFGKPCSSNKNLATTQQQQEEVRNNDDPVDVPKESDGSMTYNTCATACNALPKVRGPVWQAFVASNSIINNSNINNNVEKSNLANFDGGRLLDDTNTADDNATTSDSSVIESNNADYNSVNHITKTTAEKAPCKTTLSTSRKQVETNLAEQIEKALEDGNKTLIKSGHQTLSAKDKSLSSPLAPLASDDDDLTSNPSEDICIVDSETPVLRKVGDKTPPGTLKKKDSANYAGSSCKSWCEQYSQAFLSKTIDTPVPDVEAFEDEDDDAKTIVDDHDELPQTDS